MHFGAPVFVLAFVAVSPGLFAAQEPKPGGVAPIGEAEAPARVIPALPPDVNDPVIARTGRLKLIAMEALAIEPVPPPPSPASTPGRWDDEEEAVAPAPGRPAFRLRQESVDIAVFRNMDTEALRREWLGSLLEERIANVVRYGRLTKAQIEKLRLAGRGDIERFFAQVASVRERFLSCRNDVERSLEVLQEAAPLGLRFQEGPFGPGSLLSKTLAHMAESRR